MVRRFGPLIRENVMTLASFLTVILYFASCSQAPIEARRDGIPIQNLSINLPIPSPEEFIAVNDCESLSLRCLILHDEQHSNIVRHVDVALETKAFSERNLRSLFALMSKTHPDAIFLVVIAKTLDPLPARAKRESGSGTATSGDPTNIETYDQYIAQYYRRDG